MRHRQHPDLGKGTTSSGKLGAPGHAPSEATHLGAALLSRRPSSFKKKERFGRFVIALFALLFVGLVCYASLSSSGRSGRSFWWCSAPPRGPIIVERDVASLVAMSSEVDKLATLPALNDLVKSMAQIGAIFLKLLEDVAAAEEQERGSVVLHEANMTGGRTSSVAVALRRAADVVYAKLKAMLLQEANAQLHEAPNSIVRTTYGWMLGSVYLYSSVLPEYYLQEEDTAAHGLVLLRSINVLLWSSRVHTGPSAATNSSRSVAIGYDVFNWSRRSPCQLGLLADVPLARPFCESSFSSWSAVARRVAATYEELIALHPRYAPLRLHYIIAYAFLATDTRENSLGDNRGMKDHSVKALRIIQGDRAKLASTYQYIDAAHRGTLAFLEAFLTPQGELQKASEATLVEALGEFGTCAEARMSLLEPGAWPGIFFTGEHRPPLLRAGLLARLLERAAAHLNHRREVMHPFQECF